MSARTHPRVVGAFVLGAIAIVVAAVVALSTAHWFEPKNRFVVFFPGSVRGLNQGAAVTFRGVKIGEVKDVNAFLSEPQDSVQIEVVIEIRKNVVEVPDGARRPFEKLDSTELAKELIRRGVRARMLSQSLLTGQKYIELDFLPDEPARLVGLTRRYPELPTTPTAMEKLSAQAEAFLGKLAELPLSQMLDDLRRALQSLRDLLESSDLKGAVIGAHRATRELEPTLQSARTTIAEARALIQRFDREVTGLGGNASRTLAEAKDAFERTRKTLETLDRTLDGADQTRITAADTLEELSRALRALRNLVDYIQTHPEAVVLGKPPVEEKK